MPFGNRLLCARLKEAVDCLGGRLPAWLERGQSLGDRGLHTLAFAVACGGRGERAAALSAAVAYRCLGRIHPGMYEYIIQTDANGRGM